MSQITLPNKNITGDNLWSQVEDNDQAIADTINGDLDNGNIAAGADISGSKLLDASIPVAKLAADIDTGQLADGAVEEDQIANDAVTGGKLSLTYDTVSLGSDTALPNGSTTTIFTSDALASGLWLVIAEVDMDCEDATYINDLTLRLDTSTIGATRLEGTESAGADRRQRATITALTTGGGTVTLKGTTSTGFGSTAKAGNSRMQLVRLG